MERRSDREKHRWAGTLTFQVFFGSTRHSFTCGPLTSRRRGTNPSEGSRGNSRVAPTTDSLAGAPISPASPSPERGERSPSQEWRQQLASSWFSPSGVAVSGQFAGELTSANYRGRRVPSDNRHCRLLRA